MTMTACANCGTTIDTDTSYHVASGVYVCGDAVDCHERMAPLSDWRKPLLDLLSDAAEFVTSERSRYYGSPTLNHERIAALWNAWLSKGNTEPLHPTAPINAADASMMMLLLKVARLMESPGHRDSIADIIGYAMCYADCVGNYGSLRDE